MRAFIGIDFSQGLKKEIGELQKELRKYALKGRWKYIDNFHLTLKFLGEINFEQKKEIDDALRKICQNKKTFKLALKDLGTFDGWDSIRVLWLGLSGEIQTLESIHREIDQALLPLGFQREKRKYSPHITLGQDLVFHCSLEKIKGIVNQVEFETVKVDHLYLFKSEQIENKRIYTKISQYPLLKK